MRRITWCVTGSVILLASALAATLSPSQASIRKASVSRAPVGMAALSYARRGFPMSRPAPAPVRPTTVGITGLVKGVTGAPYPGVCVMATGPAGGSDAATHRAVSRSDGRYLIANLRPGRYALRVSNCAGPSGQGGPPVSVAWPGMRGVVTVLAGRFKTLSPAIAWPTNQFAPATGQFPAASTGKAGSISGRVTGNGRPLAHVCAVAIPASVYPLKAPEPRTTTSKTGRYRIRGLRPGRYLVVFRTGLRSLIHPAIRSSLRQKGSCS